MSEGLTPNRVISLALPELGEDERLELYAYMSKAPERYGLGGRPVQPTLSEVEQAARECWPERYTESEE